MRLFFGFDLSSDSKTAIAAWRDRFAIADGRPVPPANFHITLAFLGEVNERLVERLGDSVDARLDALPWQPWALLLNRVGYWPAPGIYWLGTSSDTAELAALARKLGSIGQEFGARRERRTYVPHVTLMRRCGSPPPAPVHEPDIEIALEDITLFESRSGRSGVVYEPLLTWSLSGPSTTRLP
jgi:2'-5' RNA ligase